MVASRDQKRWWKLEQQVIELKAELKGNEQKSSGNNQIRRVIMILIFIHQSTSEIISLQLQKAVWCAEEMSQRKRAMAVHS